MASGSSGRARPSSIRVCNRASSARTACRNGYSRASTPPLRPGPVSIKFSSTGSPAAFVALPARVKDGLRATAADVDAGRADFDKVAEVVGAAQPTGAGPAYGTTAPTAGRYLLTSPLGEPPNSAGTSSLDLTVG